jgi:hypothetical protein
LDFWFENKPSGNLGRQVEASPKPFFNGVDQLLPFKNRSERQSNKHVI